MVVLIIAFTAGDGFSATIGTWFGRPEADANHPIVDTNKPVGTGSWKEAYWNKEGINLPPAPGSSSDEIKIIRAKTVCTLDSDVGNYASKLSIAGGGEEANAPRLEIIDGGQIGIGEFRVGCGGSTKGGPLGCVNQKGGTVKLGDNLVIGRYGTSGSNPNEGKGFYTISGGTIICDPANTKAGLYIGGFKGAGPTEGTFTVVGNTADISVKKLSIASDGTGGCKGTLEFKVGPAGVSPIKVSDSVSIDLAGADANAMLAVSATGEPPKTDILLVDNQGKGPVTGIFDTVNGNPAAEGASVVLSFGGNNYGYTLTYKGGAGANDIVLRYALQPAAAPAVEKPAAPKSE